MIFRNNNKIEGKGVPLLIDEDKKGAGIQPILIEENRELIVGKGVVKYNRDFKRKPIKLLI